MTFSLHTALEQSGKKFERRRGKGISSEIRVRVRCVHRRMYIGTYLHLLDVCFNVLCSTYISVFHSFLHVHIRIMHIVGYAQLNHE